MSLSQRRSQLIGRLRHRRTRVREGLVLVEGVRAVGEALAAGADISFACVSPRLEQTAEGTALRERLEGVTREVTALDDDELAALADTEHSQGVLLICREPQGDPENVEGSVLVLDAVQDPGNVGTLVRAAVAFGVNAIIVLDGTADPWSPKAVRASAGMAFRLPLHPLPVDELLELLRRTGTELLIATAGGLDVRRVTVGERWALAVGNEGAGVRSRLRVAGAREVAVRMPGPAESLNAGVAGAILLHALTGPRDVPTREEQSA
jgi:TrmH family RNA methyltransferase